MLNVAMFTVRS